MRAGPADGKRQDRNSSVAGAAREVFHIPRRKYTAHTKGVVLECVWSRVHTSSTLSDPRTRATRMIYTVLVPRSPLAGAPAPRRVRKGSTRVYPLPVTLARVHLSCSIHC